MSQLPVRSSLKMATASSRAERQLSRQFAYGVGIVRAEAELAATRETAKLEAIAEVTEVALLATSHVSAVEALLARILQQGERPDRGRGA